MALTAISELEAAEAELASAMTGYKDARAAYGFDVENPPPVTKQVRDAICPLIAATKQSALDLIAKLDDDAAFFGCNVA